MVLSIFSCAYLYIFEKIYFQMCCQIFSCFFCLCFYYFESFKCSLYILDIRLFSDIWLANVFCDSLDCFFTFLMVSLEALWWGPSYLYFVLLLVLLIPYLKNPRSQRFGPLFSSRDFIVLDSKFRFVTHFELIFVRGVRRGVQIYFVVVTENTVHLPLNCFRALVENHQP